LSIRKWSLIVGHIVAAGNYAKFTQHDALKEFLLSTGDKILVEANPYDKNWGIGIEPSDGRVNYPAEWGE
jgi:ribA/ribD-fused uncharacterized protein